MSSEIENLLAQTKSPMKAAKRSELLGDTTCRHGIPLKRECSACNDYLGLD